MHDSLSKDTAVAVQLLSTAQQNLDEAVFEGDWERVRSVQNQIQGVIDYLIRRVHLE